MCQSKAEGGKRCFSHAYARYQKCETEHAEAGAAYYALKQDPKSSQEERQAALERSQSAFYDHRAAQVALAASGERGYLTLMLQAEELIQESYRAKSRAKREGLVALSTDRGSLAERAFYGRDPDEQGEASRAKVERNPDHEMSRTRQWNRLDGSATFTVDGEVRTLSSDDYWAEMREVETALAERAVEARHARREWIRTRLAELESGTRGSRETLEWLPKSFDARMSDPVATAPQASVQ